MSDGLCPLLDPEAYLLHPFWGHLDWGVEMYKYKSNFTTLNHEILLRTKTASHGFVFQLIVGLLPSPYRPVLLGLWSASTALFLLHRLFP